ncbi:MAG: hypothetical protein Q4D20_02535 [Clostridia bacterium]|nr:hypothetical protein [Clostridia bacterium]
MNAVNSTQVRKNWSQAVDDVIREKPIFVKRTRDCFCMINDDMLLQLLSNCNYTAEEYVEDDGSITLSLNEIDLVENAETIEEAKTALGKAILEYADEYYGDLQYWSTAPNRKAHMPYVFKAIILNDAKKIGECIKCQVGES